MSSERQKRIAPTPARRARKSPEQRAAEIDAAARELALAEGLSALTLRALAARVGVAPGLIAHYRPSMDALVAETYSGIVAAEIAEVEALLGEHAADERAALAALIRTLLDPARDDTTVVWVEAWGMGRRNPALADAVRTQMAAWHALVVALLERGVAAGHFATPDADAVAWQLLGLIDGVNAQAMVLSGGTADHARLVTRAMEALLGVKP